MLIVLREDRALAPGRITRRHVSLRKLLVWIAAAVLPWSVLVAAGRLLMVAFG